MTLPMPKIFHVRQKLDATRLDDVPGAVQRELAALDLAKTIKPGQSVAITAGSRGIANIAEILRTIAAHLKALGAQPFLVPSMGSHGGATAEGQRAVLERLGITPASVGCELRATMDVVEIGRTAAGLPVVVDRYAHEADHVFVCNRVKPHTIFSGANESGLAKMLLIGLGNHAGAVAYHRAIQAQDWETILREVGALAVARGKVAGGLGIVENGREETALVAGVKPADFLQRDAELLVTAKKYLAKLPFDDVDLLIVDEMGKDVSGSGMDTNVIGRKRWPHAAAPGETPRVLRIYVRGLTPKSGGNATGIGLAEFTTERLAASIDWPATNANALTSGFPRRAALPMRFADDTKALGVALSTIGLRAPEAARVLRIRNTLDLERVACSEIYLDEARTRAGLEVLDAPAEVRFDASGNLPPL